MYFADGQVSKFAEMTGINYQTINNWVKKSASLPGTEHLFRICSSVDVNEAWLISGKGCMSSDHSILPDGSISIWEELEELNPFYVETSMHKWFMEALTDNINFISQNSDGLEPVHDRILEEGKIFMKHNKKWLKAVYKHKGVIKQIEISNDFLESKKSTKDYKLSDSDRKLQIEAEEIEEEIRYHRSRRDKHLSNISILLKVYGDEHSHLS